MYSKNLFSFFLIGSTVAMAGLVSVQCQAQDKKAPEMKPEMTEFYEPVPPIVTPGASAANPPSDAIVLFDGKDFSKWTGKDGAPKWNIKDNAFTVAKGTGDIKTKQEFGDVQLHIEWRSPSEVKGQGQGRGNSGIFLQDRYELQVLDMYNNKTYTNGQAASIYKQGPPLANAARKPGEWQTYDVVYTAPRFNEDGSLFAPAYITVLHNGVLVQNHTPIKGSTEYIGFPQYKAHGKAPIRLQDHGDAVSYRNIWIREIKGLPQGPNTGVAGQ